MPDDQIESPADDAAAEAPLIVEDDLSVAERVELGDAIEQGAEDFERGHFTDARALALRISEES